MHKIGEKEGSLAIWVNGDFLVESESPFGWFDHDYWETMTCPLGMWDGTYDNMLRGYSYGNSFFAEVSEALKGLAFPVRQLDLFYDHAFADVGSTEECDEVGQPLGNFTFDRTVENYRFNHVTPPSGYRLIVRECQKVDMGAIRAFREVFPDLGVMQAKKHLSDLPFEVQIIRGSEMQKARNKLIEAGMIVDVVELKKSEVKR